MDRRGRERVLGYAHVRGILPPWWSGFTVRWYTRESLFPRHTVVVRTRRPRCTSAPQPWPTHEPLPPQPLAWSLRVPAESTTRAQRVPTIARPWSVDLTTATRHARFGGVAFPVLACTGPPDLWTCAWGRWAECAQLARAWRLFWERTWTRCGGCTTAAEEGECATGGKRT